MPDTQTPDDAGDFRRLKDQFRRRTDYNRGLKALKAAPDVAFMLNLDRADLPIALLGSPFGRVPFGGFLMGRQFHCPAVGVKTPPLRRRDKMAEPVFHRLLKQPRLRRVLSVDETLLTYAKKLQPTGWEKVAHVHDAAYINLTLAASNPRQTLGLPSDRFILLAYGSLSLRKGIEELLAAMEHASPRVALALAGRQDAEVSQLMTGSLAKGLRERGALYEFNRFLDDTDEANLFSACDAVWVGYRFWFGMSGVLMQAGAASKPLVSMDDGLVGFLTETHKLGLTAKIDDAVAVRQAIERLASEPDLARELGRNGAQHADGRTTEAFAAETCDQIESILQ